MDGDHLAAARARASEYARGGVLHLVLEVLAYSRDEALDTGRGAGGVTLHAGGSITVADDGRGTETRYDGDGSPVRKPVMATKDLRFFDASRPPALPDDRHPRGVMSQDIVEGRTQ